MEYCDCNALFELQAWVSKISTNGPVADSQVCMQLFKVLPYKKCGDVHENFDILENTRFKTLKHLLKAFWNNLAEFTPRERKI